MAKALEMIFVTGEGKASTISVDNPKEPVDIAQVKQAMQQIIAQNVFTTSSGDFVSIKGARVVERNVEDVNVL